jgi:hypothetical protein
MNNTIQTQMLKEQLKSKHETSHLLHLFLCVPTLGWWVIVWALVALSNSRKRDEIDDRFAAMEVEALKNDKAN